MTHTAAPDSFEAVALAVVTDLRQLFSGVIEAKCGDGPAVSEIASAFGIHRKLAWQISRVAYDQDPFMAARHMPTAKGIEVLVRAAGQRGIEASVIEHMSRASAAFEDLVRTHAGDRAAFDLLLGACSSEVDDDEASRWRQQAFTGNSFIWGAQCRTMHAMVMQFPSAQRPGFFDMAMVRGLIGLRINRPHTYWLVAQSAVLKDDSTPRYTNRESMDPDGAQSHGGVPIMKNHCRGELPGFERRQNLTGLLDDLLIPGAVGLTGERTIYTGEVIRAIAPAHATQEDRIAHFGAGVRTPTQTLVMDYFTHKDVFAGVRRELCVFSDVNSPVAFTESDRLRVRADLTELGYGLGRTQCREVPGYSRLLGDVFTRLGHDPADFLVHRVRIAYPPMPSSVMVRFELPDPPRSG